MALLVMILKLLISMSIVITMIVVVVVVIITAAMVLSAQVVQTPGPADFVHQLVPLSVCCATAS